MFDVIVIGSASRDVFINSAGFTIIKGEQFATGQGLCLPLGSKLEIKKLVLTTGGGGTNTAVTYARQGFKAACIGVVGTDPNGTAILDDLEKEGIDTQFFQKHDDDITPYSLILIQTFSLIL